MDLAIAGIGAIIVGTITLAQLAARNWNPMTWAAKRPRFWRVVVAGVLERQGHIFRRAAEQGVAERIGSETPSARIGVGKSSALTTALTAE